MQFCTFMHIIDHYFSSVAELLCTVFPCGVLLEKVNFWKIRLSLRLHMMGFSLLGVTWIRGISPQLSKSFADRNPSTEHKGCGS